MRAYMKYLFVVTGIVTAAVLVVMVDRMFIVNSAFLLILASVMYLLVYGTHAGQRNFEGYHQEIHQMRNTMNSWIAASDTLDEREQRCQFVASGNVPEVFQRGVAQGYFQALPPQD